MSDYRLDIQDIRDSYKHIIMFIENSTWKAEKPILFLKRLFELTEHVVFIENKNINSARFSPSQLTDETEDGGYPAKYANRYKTSLDEFLIDNKEAIKEFLVERNISFSLSIQTKQVGRKVFYFLAVVPLRGGESTLGASNDIEYSVVELPEPKWWVKPFLKLPFEGWKKWLFILSPVLIFLFFIVGFYYYLQIAPAPIYFAFYMSFVVIFTIIYRLAKPFYLILDSSIAVVSEGMLRMSQRSAQVEMHYLDKKAENGIAIREIRLSIYSAKCPICNGDVFIDNGKYQFKGRLIGKCRKAQTEHVFSFDHITKHGRSLL